jgi:hypothetical protein
MEARLNDLHFQTGMDPAQPLSNIPYVLLDPTGKMIVLLTMILYGVSERGLMLDEQFGCWPRHSTFLQLARFFERVTRNLGEKRRGISGHCQFVR